MSEKCSNEIDSQKYLVRSEKELTTCIKRKRSKECGDLLYNRSVVRVRQGHIEQALEDLSLVIGEYSLLCSIPTTMYLMVNTSGKY